MAISKRNRRETLAWLARAGVAVAALSSGLSACGRNPGSSGGDKELQAVKILQPGYGRDPDLLNPVVPWQLILTERQKAMVSKLADIVLPADQNSPSASAIGVADFIDEWVSAPYPEQQRDHELMTEGLNWLDKSLNGGFLHASEQAITAVLDRICDKRSAQDQPAAEFFDRFRRTCMIAYYTSPEGMADIGYTNAPAASYQGPPAEILRKMGL